MGIILYNIRYMKISREEYMKEEIRKTREKLNNIIENKGLHNERVLKISKKLDVLISQYYSDKIKCDFKM